MKLGRVEIHARMVDHHWPPAWVGPWFGVRIARKPTDLARPGARLFDVHAQWHVGCRGIETGFHVLYWFGDRPRIATNWWSPGYRVPDYE